MLYIYNNQICFKESFVVINWKLNVLGGNSIFKVHHEIVCYVNMPLLDMDIPQNYPYLVSIYPNSRLYLGLGHLSSHPAIVNIEIWHSSVLLC